MSENDALEKAGAWYVGVLQAEDAALEDAAVGAARGKPLDAAASFVASLARRGYLIELESAGERA